MLAWGGMRHVAGKGLGAAMGVSWGHPAAHSGVCVALDAGRQWPQSGQQETGPWWEVSWPGEESQSSLFKYHVSSSTSSICCTAPVLLGHSGSVLAEQAARMGHCYRLQKELLLGGNPTFALDSSVYSNSFLKREVRGI